MGDACRDCYSEFIFAYSNIQEDQNGSRRCQEWTLNRFFEFVVARNWASISNFKSNPNYHHHFTSPSMVRLITHNLLACHVKNCTSNNFPLAFKDVQIELREAEFNADFLRGFLPKIEWGALVGAAREVCI